LKKNHKQKKGHPQGKEGSQRRSHEKLKPSMLAGRGGGVVGVRKRWMNRTGRPPGKVKREKGLKKSAQEKHP